MTNILHVHFIFEPALSSPVDFNVVVVVDDDDYDYNYFQADNDSKRDVTSIRTHEITEDNR